MGQNPPGLAQQLIAAHGGQLRFTYSHAIRGFAADLPDAALEAPEHNPNVAYVEPDLPVELWGTRAIPHPAAVSFKTTIGYVE